MNNPKVPNVDGNWQSIDIFLFSNGQQYTPPRKYHLQSEELNWWDATLSNLAREHYGIQHTLINLYTTAGHKVEGPLELRDGMAYVAVEPPDPFIDTGYEKYLIKATRSWEKRQAKKASPVDLTCAEKPACEHAQPCCLCPEREHVVAVESEHTEFISTEQHFQAPDGNCMNAVPTIIGARGTWPFEFEPRMGKPGAILGENGAKFDVDGDRSGEHGPIPGKYIATSVVSGPWVNDRGQRVTGHGYRLGESNAGIIERGAQPGENGLRQGDYDTRIGEYRPKTDEYKSRPGEYGPRQGEYGQVPVQYGPEPDESGPCLGEYDRGSRLGDREARPSGTATRLEETESKINLARSGEHELKMLENGNHPDKYGSRPDRYGGRPGENGHNPGECVERTSEYYRGRAGEFFSKPDEFESRNYDRSGRVGENDSRAGRQGGRSGGQGREGTQVVLESELNSEVCQQEGKGNEYGKREYVNGGREGEQDARGGEQGSQEVGQQGSRGKQGTRGVEYSSRGPEQSRERPGQSNRRPELGGRCGEQGNREGEQGSIWSEQRCSTGEQGGRGSEHIGKDDSQLSRNNSLGGRNIVQSGREVDSGGRRRDHEERGSELGIIGSERGNRWSESVDREADRGGVEVGLDDKGCERDGKSVDLVRRSAEYNGRASEQGGRGSEQGGRGSEQMRRGSEQGRRGNEQGGRVREQGGRGTEQGGRGIEQGGRVSEQGRRGSVQVGRENERGRRTSEFRGRSGELGRLVENVGRADENALQNGGRHAGRAGDYESTSTEHETTDAAEQQSRASAHRGSRGADSTLRGVGPSGLAAFSYISEAQQHVRRSSISTTKPVTVNKIRLSGLQHPTLKKPMHGPISPVPQKRPDVSKPVRNIKEMPPKRMVGKTSTRVTNGAAAVSHVSGKPKIVSKYPHKRITPTAVPPPTANFDHSIISRKSTSLTRITPNNKSLATDGAPVENIINDKEIIVVSTNLFRNPESEVQSMRLDTVGKTLTEFTTIDSSEETPTVLTSITQSITSIPINEEVQTHLKKLDQKPNIQEYEESTSQHTTRTSSRVRVTQSSSGQRDNMVATDDPNDENYIAIINKGDVVNLKLNIEVRNGERAFNTTTSQKTTNRNSRSLTNITKNEKGSQISIEEELIVQSKSLQSILNNEYLRGTGFEGRPKVVIVQCACCGPKNSCNNPSRCTPTSTSHNDKKYFVLLSDSQREDDDRCNCDATFKQSQNGVQPQLKKHSVSLPLKRTTSSTCIESRITVQDTAFDVPKRDMGISIATTNSTCQTDDPRCDYVMTKQNVSISQGENSGPGPCTPCGPCAPCGQVSFPKKSSSQISTRTQLVTAKTSYQNICPPVVIDSLTQTDWCNVLLEARRHDDGRYSFHLPPLHVLRYYTF